jgi:hypothetical protein
MGVTFPERESLGSATDGDWSGDCMETCLVLAEASIIKGGSKGVVAKPASCSLLSLFAFSTSIGVVVVMSSRLSKILWVGVGGICGSNDLSNACRVEFDIDDDRLDGPLEAAFSCCVSEVTVAALIPFLDRHFLEKDGNLVPMRFARPVSGDSCLRFLNRGTENSPSLKNPSARS